MTCENSGALTEQDIIDIGANVSAVNEWAEGDETTTATMANGRVVPSPSKVIFDARLYKPPLIWPSAGTVTDATQTYIGTDGIVYAPNPALLPLAITGVFTTDIAVAGAWYIVATQLPAHVETETIALMKTGAYLEGTTIHNQSYDTASLILANPFIGGAEYIVVAPRAFDGYGDHELANGNIAVLQHKGRVSILQFGAKGGDGSTDDTVSAQAAMDYMAYDPTSSNGHPNDVPTGSQGSVYMPSGNYKVTNLKWRSYVSLIGEGSANTFLFASGSSGYTFDRTNVTDRPKGVELIGVTICPTRQVGANLTTARPTVGGLNIKGFEKQCLIRDVKVINLLGTGLSTGDTQDIEIENLELRFLAKSFDMSSAEVSPPSGIYNRTNAVKFIACRFENSDNASTIDGSRGNSFVSCKFEESRILITDPHGLDFAACIWAVGVDFAVTVEGGTNRGVSFLGGSVDTGLPIGGGANQNTARFITSNMAVTLLGMSFRGLKAGGIDGNVSTEDCHWSECDRPYVSGGILAFEGGSSDSDPTTSGATLGVMARNTAASYQAAAAYVPAAPAHTTWYTNYSNRAIEVTLAVNCTPSSTVFSFLEYKTSHDGGVNPYKLGEVLMENTVNGGCDFRTTVSFIVLSGESWWYAVSDVTTVSVTAIGFYR